MADLTCKVCGAVVGMGDKASNAYLCALHSQPSAYDLFDPHQALSDFYQTLPDQMFNDHVDFGKVAAMLDFKNFVGLKIYGYGLLQYGWITQDVLDRYKQVFLNQQINLDDY